MKNNYCTKSFIKFLSLACLCICNVFTAQAQETVKLHGKITNPIADSIGVVFNNERVTYNPKMYSAKVNTDGSFTLIFPVVDNFTMLQIIHGEQGTELMVAPGYNLDVSLDAKNFDSSLHYSGKGAAEANFCALHELQKGAMLDFDRVGQSFCIEAPADFEKSLDSLLQTELAFLNENKKGLNTDFVKHWEAYYRYSAYSIMLVYPRFHEMQRKRDVTVKDVPQESYTVVNDVPEKFDDKLLSLSTYQTYLQRLYYTKLDAAGIKNEKDNPTLRYRKSDSTLKLLYTKMPPKSAEYTAAIYLYHMPKTYSAEEADKELQMFKTHFPESDFMPLVEKAVATVKKITEGSPALDFIINTIDGKTMKLSDLKGKVVLVDFWASWCVPCIAQMKYAAKLEEAYKNKDVVFLNVSTDEDEAAWKSAIAKHKIEGINMRDQAVSKLYGVSTVPAYFLIDKEGKFTAMNSLRPSDGDKLKDVIDSLLK